MKDPSTMFTGRNWSALETQPADRLVRAAVRVTLDAVGRKVGRPLSRERTFGYNGLVVFDRPELDGGGWVHGIDFLRALLSLGLKRCERVFEFCAGPGYIGYHLLGNGFCETLALADLNPAAVAMAKKTARVNGIENLVQVYRSDCLDDVPATEQWDCVVANPPQYQTGGRAGRTDQRAYDADWRLHRRFYASLGRYMKPGAIAVIEESALPLIPDFERLAPKTGSQPWRNDDDLEVFRRDGSTWRIDAQAIARQFGDGVAAGSTPDIFIPMIEQGGGEYVGWMPAINVVGQHDGMYYVVSRWRG